MCKLYSLIVLLYLVHINHAQVGTFCSVVCGKNACLDPSSNSCTGCNTNWVLGGTTCVPDLLSGYEYFDKTNDLLGGLSISPIATTSKPCGSKYSFYGFVDCTQTIKVSSSVGIPKVFF